MRRQTRFAPLAPWIRRAAFARTGVLLIAALPPASVACHRGRNETVRSSETAAATDLAELSSRADAAATGLMTKEYPRSRWRLAPQASLGHVVVWLSHILIRYDGSANIAPFTPNWRVAPPAQPRSMGDAFVLAKSIAEQAAAHPGSFTDLARRYSEDLATRDAGGSLGGVTASNLLTTPSVLDALATLRPGQVSKVVATQYGLHIFMRRPPPIEAKVAARRIVVGYDVEGSDSSESVESNQRAGRRREEATAIAWQVTRAIRADGAAFDALLKRYPAPAGSDPTGDIGLWSSREPGEFARERETLAGMAVGEVSDPIDSSEGMQVLVRTAADPRPEYFVQAVYLSYSAGRTGNALRPRAQAMQLATSILQTLAAEPQRMGDFQRQYCCMETIEWGLGRTRRALVDAVSGLAVGGIAKVPLDDPPHLLIVRRVDPVAQPVPEVSFELPAPEGPPADLLPLILGASGTRVQRYVRELGEEAPRALRLDPATSARVTALHTDLSLAFANGETRETREHAVALFRERMTGLLDSDQYNRYNDLVREKVREGLMRMF